MSGTVPPRRDSCKRGDSGWGDGEVFPLPHVPEEEPASAFLSRGTRQRIQKRRAATSRVNSAVDALNWCYGCEGSPVADVNEWTAGQTCALERIQRLADERDSSCYTESEEEAARAYLRAKAGYSGEAESDLS
eukprot:1475387-Heterocapsa_arctica.AAC.1